ncbi:transcription factor bHLH93-like [Impatiens glandulifera]|uniref:transcription factor bHLH93-like n=1 Tax=Impatiens glandulifera TaxID=253017 RepID=UPI001FB1966E|nr:transcription factor bHLH93-like [Impatiens glandulifera]
MEYYSSSDQGFLEELMALKTHDPFWESTTLHPKPDFIFNNENGWGGFDSLNQNPLITNNHLPHFYNHVQTSLHQDFSSSFPLIYHDDHDHDHSMNSLTTKTETHPLIPTHDYELADLDYYPFSMPEDFDPFCKTEPVQAPQQQTDLGRKGKVKKIDGQPSKNLMAERRRRKRLNDRLSMLRSVVPKISKMDRTSILGDTIDYMKELIERINNLQEEIEVGPDEQQQQQQQFSCIFSKDELKPNEASSSSSSSTSFMIRNSPKFDVESSSNKETRIEICCAPKPGLLLSTVKTLEALDLEIQHCVISCFNDFAFKASCSQELEQSGIMSSEDIKQALFRNAGYGGRCL